MAWVVIGQKGTDLPSPMALKHCVPEITQGKYIEMLVQIHLPSWDKTTSLSLLGVGLRRELNDNLVTIVYGTLNLI